MPRRSRGLTAVVLALMVTAGSASAGGSTAPESYQLSVGVQEAGGLDQLTSDDADYSDVSSKRVESKHKVVFKTGYTGVSGVDTSLFIRWTGQTGLKQSCDLKLYAYLWKRKAWKFLAVQTVGEGPSDTDVQFGVPGEDDTRFVKDGRFKAKTTCIDDGTFLLKTDRMAVTG